jgi:hypothetical protein
MAIGIARNIIGELCGYHSAGGYAVDMLQCSAEFGDTRRTAVSAANAHNCGIAFLFNFRP